MKRLLLLHLQLFAALLLGACAARIDRSAEVKGGLASAPERLAFLCVTPGCRTEQTVRVSVLGARRVALKRALIANDTGGDFALKLSESPPFVIGENTGFDLTVVYEPKGSPGAQEVVVKLTYTDASPEESSDRIEAGELIIPLVRRLVGQPAPVFSPPALSFGYVPGGGSAVQKLRVANAGQGNIALQISGVDAGSGPYAVTLPSGGTAAPDAGVDLSVTFNPAPDGGYARGALTLSMLPVELGESVITLEGTSIQAPRIALEPSGDIDFGELTRGKQRTLDVVLTNHGGQPLNVTSVEVADPSGTLAVAPAAPALPLTLAPLSRVTLPLLAQGNAAAAVSALVTIATNDPLEPRRALNVRGTVTQPTLTVGPAGLDFGQVPTGWTVKGAVELRNTGFGPLTIKDATLVAGSSKALTLGQRPAFPLVLPRDGRASIEVQFLAEAEAVFSGALSVESDDPQGRFREVPLRGAGGPCATSCPIANGTPSCSSGRCLVGACNAGYFDSDANPANGCECSDTADPGPICQQANDIGTLNDNERDQATRTGRLPTVGDVDLYRFFGFDEASVFDEDYKVRVRLESPDPGIKLCVYRYDTAQPLAECFQTNESCPDSRSFDKGGSLGGDDSADYLVKVFRAPGSAPTCAGYTLYVSNGR